MKKVALLAAALALACAASLSAWENSVGIEISAPFFSVETKGDGTKNIIEPQGTVRYFGKAQNGFCVSAAASAGVPFSKNFTLNGEDATANGVGETLAVGAGYAFGFGERVTLAVLGSVSLDWVRFSYKREFSAKAGSNYYKSEWTQTDDALFVGLGAELLARFKLSNHISLAAACAARFVDGGALWKNGTKQGKDYDLTYDLRGNFSVVPSLGASWTF